MTQARGDAPTATHFVSFRLGTQLYALPLACVDRALRMVAVTPVPQAPSWVRGAVNVHGQVTPVVDLRRPLGHPVNDLDLDDRLLVTEIPDQTVALVVDRVEEVLAVPADQVQAATEPLSRSRPLSAVIRHNGELALVLDAARLLPTDVDNWDELLAALTTEEGGETGDDLTEIKGIGPAYAGRLRAAGLNTFAALAASEAGDVIAALGLSERGRTRVQAWLDQAAALAKAAEGSES